MGGIQRTTARIAEELTARFGHKCYNIFNQRPYPVDVPHYKYVKSAHLPNNFTAAELATLIRDWQIDCIVNQMMVAESATIRKAISLSDTSCRLLYFHHTTPRRLWDNSLRGELRSLKQRRTLINKLSGCLQILLFPLTKMLKIRRTLKKNGRDYERIYSESDKFVLLSKRFYPELLDMTNLPDTDKLRAIPNMLSFERFADAETIKNKEKRLLLVARLEEFPKMASWALKIWKKITEDHRFDEWRFDIVGHGSDEDMLKEMIRKNRIPRVTMHGRQDSEPFFERSSIFIMTSIREGFGMTLVEASQKGCVPIAFDSFASVKDIISDGRSGVLVRPFNLNDYAERLKHLMLNDSLRQDMALNCIEASKRFTSDNVMRQWELLLSEE